MTSAVSDIEAAMRVIADKLLGRVEQMGIPLPGMYCLSAADEYGSEGGPWFKYDGAWHCGLCDTDPYLSEYGEKYLLSGAGMLEIVNKLRGQGRNVVIHAWAEDFTVTIWDGDKCLACLAERDAATAPEAVIRAACEAFRK